jgi:hypothetical protein
MPHRVRRRDSTEPVLLDDGFNQPPPGCYDGYRRTVNRTRATQFAVVLRAGHRFRRSGCRVVDGQVLISGGETVGTDFAEVRAAYVDALRCLTTRCLGVPADVVDGVLSGS